MGRRAVGSLWAWCAMGDGAVGLKLQRIDFRCQVRGVRRGFRLARAADEGGDGLARDHEEGIGQRAQIIRLLKPYDMFGYRAVIGEDHFTSCASAFEPCTTYRVPASVFLTLLRQNSDFCYQVLVAMARDLAVAELQTINLTQKHIRGRLAESLLTLKNNYGLDEDGCTLSMYMSREDLANMSNMTTSNAIRTLSQFAQEGLISVDGRKIKLLNEEEVKKISRLG